jgi:hypothetical protein
MMTTFIVIFAVLAMLVLLVLATILPEHFFQDLLVWIFVAIGAAMILYWQLGF